MNLKKLSSDYLREKLKKAEKSQKDDYFELWRKIGSHSEKILILYTQTKEEAVNNASEWIRYNLIE